MENEETEGGNKAGGILLLVCIVTIIIWGGIAQDNLLRKTMVDTGKIHSAKEISEGLAKGYKMYWAMNILTSTKSGFSVGEAVELQKQRNVSDVVYVAYPSFRLLATPKNLAGTYSLRRWLNGFYSRSKAIIASNSWYISIPTAAITALITLPVIPLIWLTDLLIYFNPLAIIGSIGDVIMANLNLLAGAVGYYQ